MPRLRQGDLPDGLSEGALSGGVYDRHAQRGARQYG